MLPAPANVDASGYVDLSPFLKQDQILVLNYSHRQRAVRMCVKRLSKTVFTSSVANSVDRLHRPVRGMLLRSTVCGNLPAITPQLS